MNYKIIVIINQARIKIIQVINIKNKKNTFYEYLNYLVLNEGDDAINDALINAMNQMESAMKQKQNNDNNSHKHNDDAALRKHKSQVLAKYSEISDEDLDYEDEQETSEGNLFQNTNAQMIEDRERKSREAQHEVKSMIFILALKHKRNSINLLKYFRHIKSNKKKIKWMLIIKNKKMMKGKRKHNNGLKNKRDVAKMK